MRKIIRDTKFHFKRSAWIKPPIGQTILVYNSCDGYHLASWSGEDFISATGDVLPDGMAELWHELPTEENLLNALNDRAFIELPLETLTDTQLA
jgi:hypothetical protein